MSTASSPTAVPHPPGAHPPPRPRRKIDWELISCGMRGHFLVGLGAREIRDEDEMLARDAEGFRWHRCLRCDSWVPIPPPEDPDSDHPPSREEIELPLRGKGLRDRVVLRLIAVDRALHFLILVALGVAVLLFAEHETNLRSTYYHLLGNLQGGVGGGPVQSSGHVGITKELDKIFSLQAGKLTHVGIALVAFGLLEGVEAVGLWLTKRWAEYLTFIATTVLLPLEINEIIHGATPLKIIGFLINLAVVIYLLFAKRLFGLRGGGKVDEEERRRDTSWDAVRRTTPPASPEHGRP